MTEKVVVLASNSFLGAHFVDHLMSVGADVAGISRSPQPDKVFLAYRRAGRRDLRFHQLDLNVQLDRLMRVIGNFRPGYVVNFAAQSMAAQSWERPEQWFQTNCVAMIQLHDRLRRFDFLRKYVHISTPAVYGRCTSPAKEDTPYNPATPYAVSRAAADMSLATYHRHHGFPSVVARVADVYGPAGRPCGIIPQAVLHLLTGKKVRLLGDGASVQSFLHVRDATAGIAVAMTEAPVGEVFHFASNRNLSLRALVGMICEQMGLDFEQHTESVPAGPNDDASCLLDSSKARRQLEWRDRISLEEGIEEVIGWVRDHLDILRSGTAEYAH